MSFVVTEQEEQLERLRQREAFLTEQRDALDRQLQEINQRYLDAQAAVAAAAQDDGYSDNDSDDDDEFYRLATWNPNLSPSYHLDSLDYSPPSAGHQSPLAPRYFSESSDSDGDRLTQSQDDDQRTPDHTSTPIDTHHNREENHVEYNTNIPWPPPGDAQLQVVLSDSLLDTSHQVPDRNTDEEAVPDNWSSPEAVQSHFSPTLDTINEEEGTLNDSPTYSAGSPILTSPTLPVYYNSGNSSNGSGIEIRDEQDSDHGHDTDQSESRDEWRSHVSSSSVLGSSPAASVRSNTSNTPVLVPDSEDSASHASSYRHNNTDYNSHSSSSSSSSSSESDSDDASCSQSEAKEVGQSDVPEYDSLSEAESGESDDGGKSDYVTSSPGFDSASLNDNFPSRTPSTTNEDTTERSRKPGTGLNQGQKRRSENSDGPAPKRPYIKPSGTANLSLTRTQPSTNFSLGRPQPTSTISAAPASRPLSRAPRNQMGSELKVSINLNVDMCGNRWGNSGNRSQSGQSQRVSRTATCTAATASTWRGGRREDSDSDDNAT